MTPFGTKRRWLVAIPAFAFILIFLHFFSSVPGLYPVEETLLKSGFGPQYEPVDGHPISKLIAEADLRWREYDEDRSITFKEAVSKYRRKYGRHPPPRFDAWYKFARKNNVHNIDDFEQIMDDLRPFWAVQPVIIRRLAAHAADDEKDGISTIHIRNNTVAKTSNPGWRSDDMASMLDRFLDYLPDMDIPMNRLDQPRVALSWDDLQKALEQEASTRKILPHAHNEFTAQQPALLDLHLEDPKQDNNTREDPEWFNAPGKQFMEIARVACPPESYANGGQRNESTWKSTDGGVVTNFNLSSDLCTMGPDLQDMHGLMFTSSSMRATRRLVPVFGECKVNINNDILFPANKYWEHDERYEYDGSSDVNWKKKKEDVVWRGATSGGVQLADNWNRMHRQRLIMMMNASVVADREVCVLTEKDASSGEYEVYDHFNASGLLAKYSDVGFIEYFGCIPDCSFYNTEFALKPEMKLSKQFEHKYLLDVDGHSFSGRFRAFLQSKSLGIKATIFREWHDSRIFAWRHFVPMDNRFDDIYTILTYFVGVGTREEAIRHGKAFVPRHDQEAKRLALQGRDWANKVLRREDIEVYMFRLLIEYGRIIDDNRDSIGYSGDGSELDKSDAAMDRMPS